MDAGTRICPNPHHQFIDLVPDHGVKLTPKHYAYLKISEGCNHRCSFCIILSMRGDPRQPTIGEVMREAESLVKSGVKELLVISRDTSAYGVDVKHRTDFVNGKPVKTRMLELAESLGQLGVWTRMHYVYPYPSVDNVIPLMAQSTLASGGRVCPTWTCAVSARQPAHPQAHEAPGQRREKYRAHSSLARDLS